IERSKHSVTAKASEATNALFIEAESFRKSFSGPLVRHVVNTIAARLRSSYAITKSIMEERGDEGAICKSADPTIEGISRLVADKLLTYVELKEFPFTVSNFNSQAAHSVISPNSLKVPLPGVPELSDNHFEVVKRDGDLYVRDLGGPHGTLVNNEALSRYSMNAIAKLKPGRNEVVAGGSESPVRFSITLPQNS
ncbi:MAG: FHA domain-containing protein, partial [Kordiimonas sp.]